MADETGADHSRSSPTTGEQGLPGVEASVWNAFFLPKGTPEPIVRKLNKAMSDTLDDPTIRKRLEELGLEIVAPERRTPEYLAKYLPRRSSAGRSRSGPPASARIEIVAGSETQSRAEHKHWRKRHAKRRELAGGKAC